MQRTGILVVGHGSREAASNQEFEALVHRISKRRSEFDVRHAYVELAAPTLADSLNAIASRNARVVVTPFFLFSAAHVKNDIPLALAGAQRKFPTVRFLASRVLGVHPTLAELAYQRALEAGDGLANPKQTALIIVGRGSSDPDANGDFCKLARLLAEGHELGWVIPAFIGITRPLFGEAIELIARARPKNILVVPYFLFAGRLISQLEAQVEQFRTRYPWIRTTLASHLGVDSRLLEVFDERLDQALSGRAPLPCDNCQYRAPIGTIVENVGGFRSLLWSARHMETHSQAMPHVHPHQPMRRHVLVCGNVDCASRGSIALIAELRRALRRVGREREIRITRTSCMGRCGEGPTVAIYPDGIWYRRVTPADANEVVDCHLVGDRLVGRLVDAIMQ
jgi:sirohydrochlorin cobaltochelatase